MTPAVPRPASTVVLVRQARGAIQVFLVRRHESVAFMGGAHVFPGGRVDAADYLDHPEDVCDGVARAVARMGDADPRAAVAHHVAAIRELFEEAGVLLARDVSGALVALEADTAAAFDAHRRALAAGTLTLIELARRERLRLALDALAHFAHWITPELESRRFDTRFFLALAPDAQQPSHDNGEMSHGEWLTPADAVAACRSGNIVLPPPTWTTLRKLAAFQTVQEAWRWASTCPVPRVQPGAVVLDDGTRLVALPGDPLCPAIAGFDAEEKRFLLAEGRWRPVSAPPAAD